MLRKFRIGVRLGVAFTVVTVMLAGAAVMGLYGINHQRDAAARSRALQNLVRIADQIKYYDADVSGWQVAYAWDTRRIGIAAALAGTSGSNRAGFLADKQKLTAVLASMPAGQLTASELTLYTSITDSWTSYWAADDKVVAAYKTGSLAAGDTAVLGPGYDVYYQIVEATDKLVAALNKRMNTETSNAKSSATTVKTAVTVALIAAIVLAVLFAWTVTRSIIQPLSRTVEAMRRVAAGDLTSVPRPEGADEVATADRALAEAITNTRAAVSALARALRR